MEQMDNGNSHYEVCLDKIICEAPLSVLRTFGVKMGIVMGIPSIY